MVKYKLTFFLTLKEQKMANMSQLTNDAIERLSAEFKAAQIPNTSRTNYLMAWGEFQTFLEKNNHLNGCSEKSLEAFFFYKREICNFKASSLFSLSSKLKTVALSQGFCFSKHFWDAIYRWFKDCGKNEKTFKAPMFDFEDIQEWIQTSKEDEPRDVQQKIAIFFAINGAMRCKENYSLKWTDVVINAKNMELQINIVNTKSGKARSQIITDKKCVFLVQRYSKIFGERTKNWFYATWNAKFNVFNNKRRGIRFFQDLPKVMATDLGLMNPNSYTHHSFRRTTASFLHHSGLTLKAICDAGGWKDVKTVEGYISECNYQKRKMGNALSLSKVGKRKATLEDLSLQLGNLTKSLKRTKLNEPEKEIQGEVIEGEKVIPSLKTPSNTVFEFHGSNVTINNHYSK